jgi:Xaa-Pro aminopeptidase
MNLFLHDQDPAIQMWEAQTLGFREAKEMFKADAAYSLTELPNYIQSLSKTRSIYSNLNNLTTLNEFHVKLNHGFMTTPFRPVDFKPPLNIFQPSIPKFKSINQFLGPLRNKKSEKEQERMKECGEVTAEVYQEVLKSLKRMPSESYLHAFFEFQGKARGAWGCGYIPVVASGSNATILHYTQNNCLLK